MFKSVDEFYAKAKEEVRVFNDFISMYGLKGFVMADHICYKCGSSEIFESIRRVFESDSNWIYQAIISKRRIATIGTRQNLETLAGKISLVELSDQKPDGSQNDGFDHIEIYPTTITYDQLVLNLRNQGLNVEEVVRPHHTTHDIKIENGFIIRLTRESLLNKIKKEQM
jgi:predicted metalloenzyme YecM